MGVMDAFDNSGWGSKHMTDPDPVDVPNVEFESVFGSEPRVTGGRAVNLRDLMALNNWRKLRRQFNGFVNFEMSEELLTTIMESTGGVPMAWESTSGAVYIVLAGFPTLCPYFPAHVFQNPNIGKPEVSLWRYLISQGGYVPNLPSAAENPGIEVMRKKNEANKPG